MRGKTKTRPEGRVVTNGRGRYRRQAGRPLTRWASRDKSKDAMTEAATHRIYDMAEAAGGDDDIHRGPGARRPEERDAARGADL